MLKVHKTGLIWIWVSVLVIVIDYLSKSWMLQHLTYHQPVPILPFLNFTLAFNTGAAFSFLDSNAGWQNIFFTTLALVVTVGVLIYLYRSLAQHYWQDIALCLIIGGALGNVWDRAQYGYVIDFIDFHINAWHFAIFNLADSAISIGTVMLMLNWLFPSRFHQ